jgi:hypothetical protein
LYLTIWNDHPYGQVKRKIRVYRSLDEIPETFDLDVGFWESLLPQKTKDCYHIITVSLLEYFEFLRR